MLGEKMDGVDFLNRFNTNIWEIIKTLDDSTNNYYIFHGYGTSGVDQLCKVLLHMFSNLIVLNNFKDMDNQNTNDDINTIILLNDNNMILDNMDKIIKHDIKIIKFDNIMNHYYLLAHDGLCKSFANDINKYLNKKNCKSNYILTIDSSEYHYNNYHNTNTYLLDYYNKYFGRSDYDLLSKYNTITLYDNISKKTYNLCPWGFHNNGKYYSVSYNVLSKYYTYIIDADDGLYFDKKDGLLFLANLYNDNNDIEFTLYTDIEPNNKLNFKIVSGYEYFIMAVNYPEVIISFPNDCFTKYLWISKWQNMINDDAVFSGYLINQINKEGSYNNTVRLHDYFLGNEVINTISINVDNLDGSISITDKNEYEYTVPEYIYNLIKKSKNEQNKEQLKKWYDLVINGKCLIRLDNLPELHDYTTSSAIFWKNLIKHYNKYNDIYLVNIDDNNKYNDIYLVNIDDSISVYLISMKFAINIMIL